MIRDELKKYVSPELKLKLHLLNDEDIQWSDLLTSEHPSFRVNHDINILMQNQVHIPMFVNPEMIPFEYVKKGKHDEDIYPSYCHFADIKVNYKRGNILKFTHRFGVKVFKMNDERFLAPIVLEEVPYHFKYDHDEQRWRYVQINSVEEHWLLFKERLDEMKEHEDIKAAGRAYFTARKRVQPLQSERYPTYKDEVVAYQKLVNSTYSFIEFKYLLGEMGETHFQYIAEHIQTVADTLQQIDQYIDEHALYEKMDTSQISGSHGTEHLRVLNLLGTVQTQIKRYWFTAAYWIYDDDIYPNIAEHYDLLQQAKSNRNDDTKFELKQLYLHHKSQKNYLTIDEVKR